MRLTPVRQLHAPGSHLCGLAWDGTHLWHSDGTHEAVFKLDPIDGTVAQRIPCRGVRTGLAYDGRYLWQVVGKPKRLCQLEQGKIVGYRAVLPASNRLCGLEFAQDNLWLGFHAPGVIEKRSAATLELLTSNAVEGDVADITFARGTLLYTTFSEAMLNVLDHSFERVAARYPLGFQPTGLTWDGELLWICDFHARIIRAFQLEVGDDLADPVVHSSTLQ